MQVYQALNNVPQPHSALSATLERKRDRKVFSFLSWAKMQSEQMSFQSATEGVKSFCWPDINGERVPPLCSQDSLLNDGYVPE